jgi:hypothetical protein
MIGGDTPRRTPQENDFRQVLNAVCCHSRDVVESFFFWPFLAVFGKVDDKIILVDERGE